MRLDEMYYTEIEMEWMKEILRDKEEEIKKLKSDLSLVIKERDDNIKQNKKLKDELEKLKSTYVYDAKQVRDIC